MNDKTTPSTRRRVLIIGGGLAGLSAAEALARENGDLFEITLLEAKQNTGGRAGSFSDPQTGEAVDYCQHVAMGCNTNLLALLERCGLSDCMTRYDELPFLHPDHPPSRFAASPFLPAPLHLAPTLRSLRFLTHRQRQQIRRGLMRLFRTPSETLAARTAGDWLRSAGQDPETIRNFWDVILVSALGEQTNLVSMAAARKVLVDGFAAARGASHVLVPKLPLAELFGKRIRDAIQELGVTVLASTPVRRVINPDHDRAVVETNDGRRRDADQVIAAVPWHAIANLLADIDLPGLDRYAEFPSSPITGVHLWFDREITDRPHAVMVGTIAQWLFRRGEENQSPHSECYYQVVISASREAKSLAKEHLVETILSELRHAFPKTNEATLLRSRIVADTRSVFSIRPQVEAARPPARTPLPWLHLAGDWIATGWPATMEGAVISGRMAASSLLEREGLDSLPIDNGLPRSWLARWLITS